MEMLISPLLLKQFQKADEITDLAGVQPELRHAWMTGHDPLSQSFFQRFDGISLVQDPERRRDGQGTLREFVDRMAVRAIGLCESLASSGVRCAGVFCRENGKARRQ